MIFEDLLLYEDAGMTFTVGLAFFQLLGCQSFDQGGMTASPWRLVRYKFEAISLISGEALVFFFIRLITSPCPRRNLPPVYFTTQYSSPKRKLFPSQSRKILLRPWTLADAHAAPMDATTAAAAISAIMRVSIDP